MFIPHWLVSRRELVGSDLVIVAVSFMHLYEAVTVARTHAADGSMGVAALLSVFHYHWLVAAGLIFVVTCAFTGEWLHQLSPTKRLALLLPQQSMLIITSTGALMWAFSGHYADGVLRSFYFISCDQLPRILNPVLYTAAILARSRV